MSTIDQTTRPVPVQRHLHLRRPTRSTASASAPCGSPGTGYGASRPTGTHACAVLRRAVELGVDLIDTADSYGPEVSEDSSSRPSTPTPTGWSSPPKAGLTRQGPGRWLPVGRPEYLRQQCELSLRRLGARAASTSSSSTASTPRCRPTSSSACWPTCSTRARWPHVGLSQVSVAEIEAARAVVPVRQRAEPLST